MTKNLIIVESYTKTKTISKYLNFNNDNNKYIVTFSQGHFCDLPKDSLGIDINTWKAKYIITKKKIIDNIRNLINNVDNIYIASDPDIEGEAIAYHIKNHIKDLIKNKNCYRIKFNEITKKAILNAIDNPLDIDNNLVNAQETRRFLDRIVGFKLSPILWNKFNNNFLSVGRVQSVALLLSINKFNDIKNFEISKFWTLSAKFNINNISLDTYSIKINNENDIQNILKLLDNPNNIFNIQNSLSSKNENPPSPYTTTSLQQDVYNNFRFNSKTTMELSQKLYELGLITYMRTDSVNISDDFKNKIKKYIKDNYSEDLFLYRNFKNKIINSQQAHEAIRITNPYLIDISNYDTNINDKHIKIYNLIWKRTIASQLISAKYTIINSVIQCTNNNNCKNFIFKSVNEFLTEPGFLTIYNKKKQDYNTLFNNLNTNTIIPINFNFNADITYPPSLYNEISLIKKLEKEGIGRPSTYSTIIEKLFTKKYIIKGKNPENIININNYEKKHNKNIKITNISLKTGGKNTDLLLPTQLGFDIIEYLNDIIPFLLNINFTQQMESTLDDISTGKITKNSTLNEFYFKILPIIEKFSNQNIINKNNYQDGIINTKYGFCYYHKKDNRYVNIESYLKWKNIDDIKLLTTQEINFLSSLPKKIDDKYHLHIGKYGLYLKDSNNNNIKLDKNKWNNYI